MQMKKILSLVALICLWPTLALAAYSDYTSSINASGAKRPSITDSKHDIVASLLQPKGMQPYEIRAAALAARIDAGELDLISARVAPVPREGEVLLPKEIAAALESTQTWGGEGNEEILIHIQNSSPSAITSIGIEHVPFSCANSSTLTPYILQFKRTISPGSEAVLVFSTSSLPIGKTKHIECLNIVKTWTTASAMEQ